MADWDFTAGLMREWNYLQFGPMSRVVLGADLSAGKAWTGLTLAIRTCKHEPACRIGAGFSIICKLFQH